MNELKVVESEPISIGHFIKGQFVEGGAVVHGPAHARFATPELKLNELVWPRSKPGPAFETPLSEILDLLEETGKWLARDPDGLVAEALNHAVRTNPLPRAVIERSYAELPLMFNRAELEYEVDQELGGKDILDGWREMPLPPSGRQHRIRAYPSRMVHIMAGNAAGAAALTVLWAALSKGVHLLKLPSNDLHTATMLLRALAAVGPNHPTTKSFSAVYWRGGDSEVESRIFRSQYFDKLAAWGGHSALKSAKDYIGPGFELVAFDPKTSISMVGREVFESEEMLQDAADRAASDATLVEQQACASSRFQFVEGTPEQVDRYCEALYQRMGIERPYAMACGRQVPGDIRAEVEGLRGMEEFYRIWGNYEGQGVVIRSEDPVEFHPDGRVVNVVPVADLADAIEYVNVATQTVGIFPPSRKEGLRNALGNAGVQRVVDLGHAMSLERGLTHDGFFPLHRFMRWVNDEGGA